MFSIPMNFFALQTGACLILHWMLSPPLPPNLMWCWMWKEDRQEVEGSFVGKVKGKAEKIGGYHIPVRKRTEFLSLGHPFFEKCLKVCIFKDPCDLVSYPPSQSGYSVL